MTDTTVIDHGEYVQHITWFGSESSTTLVTTDGFGIRTELVLGDNTLLQITHDAPDGEILEYPTADDALEALEYVASRSHYGV